MGHIRLGGVVPPTTVRSTVRGRVGTRHRQERTVLVTRNRGGSTVLHTRKRGRSVILRTRKSGRTTVLHTRTGGRTAVHRTRNRTRTVHTVRGTGTRNVRSVGTTGTSGTIVRLGDLRTFTGTTSKGTAGVVVPSRVRKVTNLMGSVARITGSSRGGVTSLVRRRMRSAMGRRWSRGVFVGV